MSLNFLYTAVSWVLLRWHSLFDVFLPSASGLNWTLSIILLVITARLLLVRLFIRQVHYQRRMQAMQPRVQALRDKYKDNRTEVQRQLVRLQQEEGFNPLAGCLPILIQVPVFIGLFHVLRHLANAAAIADHLTTRTNSTALPANFSLYGFTPTQTVEAARARLFGAPLASRLTDTRLQIQHLHGSVAATHIIIALVVVVAAMATLATQLLVRRGQAAVPVGSAATVQRILLLAVPITTLGSGLFFPLGVLLYWLTSNVWTAAQQLYINKFHATPPDIEPEPDAGSPPTPSGPPTGTER